MHLINREKILVAYLFVRVSYLRIIFCTKLVPFPVNIAALLAVCMLS